MRDQSKESVCFPCGAERRIVLTYNPAADLANVADLCAPNAQEKALQLGAAMSFRLCYYCDAGQRKQTVILICARFAHQRFNTCTSFGVGQLVSRRRRLCDFGNMSE